MRFAAGFIVLLVFVLGATHAATFWPHREDAVLPRSLAKDDLVFLRPGALGYVSSSAFILDEERHLRIYKDADVDVAPGWYISIQVMRTEDGACVDTSTIPADAIGFSRFYRYDYTFHVEECDLSQFRMGYP